jgi:flagellar basal-body rod modification protein FlgD
VTTDPTTAATATSASGATAQKSTALGQDAFMKLLITQLQHQDPTAPQDDSAFIAQLAQFSSLEKLTTMDQSLTSINQMLTALKSLAPAPSTSTTPAATAAAPTSGSGTAPATTTTSSTAQDTATTPKGTV